MRFPRESVLGQKWASLRNNLYIPFVQTVHEAKEAKMRNDSTALALQNKQPLWDLEKRY